MPGSENENSPVVAEQSANASAEAPTANTDRHVQFAEHFVRNQNDLYRYICSLVANRTDAEELFQETNLWLWKTWDRFDTAREFLPWAFAIAHNQIRNHLRKKSTRHLALSPELLDQLTATRLKREDTLAGRKAALASCLGKLDPPDRKLLEKCYAPDQTIKEVAESNGESPNAIYKRLRRLRKSLFHCVTRSLVGELSG